MKYYLKYSNFGIKAGIHEATCIYDIIKDIDFKSYAIDQIRKEDPNADIIDDDQLVNDLAANFEDLLIDAFQPLEGGDKK